MKDLFSARSDRYARYRPTYPPSLFEYLRSLAKHHHTLWDCATGNGQVAGPLSSYFEEVYATDISSSQLSNAVQAPNIFYSVQPAEKADFPAAFFDMVTVSQAIHWFDFAAFYKEVYRTLKDEGIIAVMGYGMFSVIDDEQTDRLTQHFYHDITGPYWEPERKFVDEYYRGIPFPFEELETPEFAIEKKWTLDDCLGFLSTWSAVKHYIRVNRRDPVEEFNKQLSKNWSASETKLIRFPVFIRAGFKKSE